MTNKMSVFEACLFLVAVSAPLGSSVTSVVRFPCGRDRCVRDEQYCSHEGTLNKDRWMCADCSEEKCQDRTINPQCSGFCLRIEYERRLGRLNKTYERKMEEVLTLSRERLINTTKHLQSQLDNKDKTTIVFTVVPSCCFLIALAGCLYYRYKHKSQKPNKTLIAHPTGHDAETSEILCA